MRVYHKQVCLSDGFYALGPETKEARLIGGREISRPSGWSLWVSLKGQEIKCWACGVVADRWIVENTRGGGKPVCNLYATGMNGGQVMMTRDHIIPKVKGGCDKVDNLRPGCEDCNSARGHEMSEDDQKFMDEHPELIDAVRLKTAIARQYKHQQREDQQAKLEGETKTARRQRLAQDKFPKLTTMMVMALA